MPDLEQCKRCSSHANCQFRIDHQWLEFTGCGCYSTTIKCQSRWCVKCLYKLCWLLGLMYPHRFAFAKCRGTPRRDVDPRARSRAAGADTGKLPCSARASKTAWASGGDSCFLYTVRCGNFQCVWHYVTFGIYLKLIDFKYTVWCLVVAICVCKKMIDFAHIVLWHFTAFGIYLNLNDFKYTVWCPVAAICVCLKFIDFARIVLWHFTPFGIY